MREKALSVWEAVSKAAKPVAITIATLSAATIAGSVAWIALSDQNRPKHLDLIAVLAITFTAIVLASFVVALVHRAINPEATHKENGEVLRESIRRFAWLASPIAASYGLAQVATQIASIVAEG